MERDAVIIFRVPKATKDALEQHAKAKTRTLSNMTLCIVTEWLDAQAKSRAAPKGSKAGKRR
jgi:hypothetical protein